MKASSKYEDFIEYLNAGKICVFETDTVVGLSCKIFKENEVNKNVDRIFTIKNRNSLKALPWLISSEQMLNEYAIKIPDFGKKIIEKKWPGATTLIFNVKDFVPKNLTVITKNENKTVAFRMPDCEELITAIDFVNSPLATTSANLSGKKAVSSIGDVDKKILEQVDFVYEKKLHLSRKTSPSEIISCLGEGPVIIRKLEN